MLKRLICMMCYKGTLSGNCCDGYTDPDSCGTFEEQVKCSAGLVFNGKYNCYECAKGCDGCFEMRVKFGFAKHEDVAHLMNKGV